MENIKLDEICKSYGSHIVLNHITKEFESGTVHVISGPSGCGKTTLLRILMNLETIDGGTISDMRKYRKAAVFQEDRLCENLSAGMNVMMVMQSVDRNAFRKRLEKDFQQIGLTDIHQKVSTLSGGMKRRIAILRAVYADADILFFDEPLKGLDDGTKIKVIEYIKANIRDKTVFWVTHDHGEHTHFDKYKLHELS